MMMTAMGTMTMLEVSCLVYLFVKLHPCAWSLADSQLPGLHACVPKCLVRLHALCLRMLPASFLESVPQSDVSVRTYCLCFSLFWAAGASPCLAGSRTHLLGLFCQAALLFLCPILVFFPPGSLVLIRSTPAAAGVPHRGPVGYTASSCRGHDAGNSPKQSAQTVCASCCAFCGPA